MKLIDILLVTDKNARIKLFINDDVYGILYVSPFNSALKNKYYYDINKIFIRNNILNIKVTSSKSNI